MQEMTSWVTIHRRLLERSGQNPRGEVVAAIIRSATISFLILVKMSLFLFSSFRLCGSCSPVVKRAYQSSGESEMSVVI